MSILKYMVSLPKCPNRPVDQDAHQGSQKRDLKEGKSNLVTLVQEEKTLLPGKSKVE